MIRLITTAGIAVLALTLAPAAARAETIATDFGYAMAAGTSCDGLFIKVSTEPTLEGALGHKLRGPDAPTNGEYMSGMFAFYDAEESVGSQSACQAAWNRLGCSGSDGRNLLIEDPFSVANPTTCDVIVP